MRKAFFYSFLYIVENIFLRIYDQRSELIFLAEYVRQYILTHDLLTAGADLFLVNNKSYIA